MQKIEERLARRNRRTEEIRDIFHQLFFLLESRREIANVKQANNNLLPSQFYNNNKQFLRFFIDHNNNNQKNNRTQNWIER